ncbi:MAG: transglycosylase SLT domain-containing protein, partial [Actinomycetota bacterium]|nr:transglycosylase SLT domain-containing protein [Actinomycetota bacterium]
PAPRTAPAHPAPDSRGAAPAHRSADRVRGWIDEAVHVLREHGYQADQLDPGAIATIIHHESGGNPSAVNHADGNAARGTPSSGLMQTIPPTFRHYSLPGHDQILNPVDNIIAGVRYAIARYGSVSRVPGVLSMGTGHGYRGY